MTFSKAVHCVFSRNVDLPSTNVVVPNLFDPVFVALAISASRFPVDWFWLAHVLRTLTLSLWWFTAGEVQDSHDLLFHPTKLPACQASLSFSIYGVHKRFDQIRS